MYFERSLLCLSIFGTVGFPLLNFDRQVYLPLHFQRAHTNDER
jgi:hypothetical protein